MSQAPPKHTSPTSTPTPERRRPHHEPQMSNVLRTWRLFHWFSFDIGLGAAMSAMWVGRAWGSQPSMWCIIALSCGALWVYSVDHWADAGQARTLMPHQISERRDFYIRMRLWLALVAITSALIGGWASLKLPWFTLVFGVIYLAICVVYLWVVQRRSDYTRVRYPKEILITTLYTMALTLWPISHIFDPPSTFSPWGGSLSSALIFCLAWSNLCLISVHERRSDAAEGSVSLALKLGEFTTRNVGKGALRFGVFIWGLRFIPTLLFGTYDIIDVLDALVGGLMLITLWRLYRRPEWSARFSRYRLWADLIFIYPALGLLIDWI